MTIFVLFSCRVCAHEATWPWEAVCPACGSADDPLELWGDLRKPDPEGDAV